MSTINLSGILYNGKPDYSISNNNLNFNIKGITEVITSYDIKPYDKSYFEFTITSYNSINGIKYVPLYVGVSKEISQGVNSNDFCYGSIFYDMVSANYSIIENTKGSMTNIERSPLNITAKTPIINDIVGVGIDAQNNEITIYVNGNILYSFNPVLFDIGKTTDKIYAAIYCPNGYGKIHGKFNFGKSTLSYLPSGFISAHRVYNKFKVSDTISGKLIVKRDEPAISKELTGTINIDSIKGNGDVYLVQDNSVHDLQPGNLKFLMRLVEAPLFSNLPFPNDLKVYTEIYIRDGILSSKYLGVPISIGFTDSPSAFLYESPIANYINIQLYHILQRPYIYIEHKSGSTVSKKYIGDLETIIPAEQGRWIGIELDPLAREITIWINKIKYYTYKFDMPIPHNPYLYIKNDRDVYVNNINGEINFGAEEDLTSDFSKIFKGNKPDDCISLWHYYNRMGHFAVTNMPEIVGQVIVNNTPEDINGYIVGYIIVGETELEEGYEFGNGLNRMYKTYSVMSDTDPHNIEPKYHKYPYINKLIAKHNDGYYPNDLDDPDLDNM